MFQMIKKLNKQNELHSQLNFILINYKNKKIFEMLNLEENFIFLYKNINN